jgi:hypothetical protein
MYSKPTEMTHAFGALLRILDMELLFLVLSGMSLIYNFSDFIPVTIYQTLKLPIHSPHFLSACTVICNT